MACDSKNPLVRDGVSQKQRLVQALKPSYAKVDERSMEDLLHFLVNYAKDVSYFDTFNNLSGSWKEFIERDITVIIALIAKKDASIEQNLFQLLINNIEDPGTSETNIQKNFKTLFDLLFTIIYEFDKWYTLTTEGLGIQSYLKRVIRSQVKPELERLIGYYKGALTSPELFETGFDQTVTTDKYELSEAQKIIETGLQDVWYASDIEGSGYDNWTDFYNDIDANETVYGIKKTDPLVDASVKIDESLDSFELSFNNLYATLLQVIQKAPFYVEETIQKFAAHEPHMGLILSFLKLFKHAQAHLNGITKRHLDFYYEKVLQLSRQDAVPNNVHLIYELAKHVDDHKLEVDTLLKAGKDDLGNEVLYETTAEDVFNKASIAKLKSIYVDKADNWRVYASPVTNSLDGNGAGFEVDDPKWKAFGEPQKDISSNRTMPDADIGFAICSPNLLLNEGDRHIILQLECKDNIPSSGITLSSALPDTLQTFLTSNYTFTNADTRNDLSDLLSYAFTGEKAWIATTDSSEITYYAFSVNKFLFVYIGLGTGLPAVKNYDIKIHGTGFETNYPILKLTANPENTENYLNNIFNDSRINSLKLEVIGNELKNLLVQNDNGVLDPAKPFQPFTAQPAIGSRFYIGSHEVFKKDLNKLELTIDWHNLPSDDDFNDYYNYNSLPVTTGTPSPYYDYNPENTFFKATADILNNNDWTKLLSGDKVQLFDDDSIKEQAIISLTDSSVSIGTDADMGNFSMYSIDLKRGFIRIILKEPTYAFGHKIYSPLLTKQLISQSIDIPVEPYTPEIKSISLNYASSEVIELAPSTNYNTRISKYYQIHPFGTQEVHEYLSGGTRYVLPQFKHDNSGTVVKHQGMFMIGLKDLDPPQNVSILFKVAEGSADPEFDKQDITWYYLDDDEWIEFQVDEIVSDSTNGLLTTGIIKFAVPRNATNKNNIVDSGYHWIMGTVPQNSEAICDLMEVYTQAGIAAFKDNNNDPNFLSSSLLAETISKLKVKEAEVKSITQPYASFGGKVKETDNEFYRRVSERLRHKSRGISIWDYERMILEEFPEVYKAKCINHSTYDFKIDEDTTLNSEFAPGYVTIIVVPELKNQNATDPLKPRVSLNTLDEIKTFLTKYNSPFAAETLKVINPLFEEIQVEFYVEFHTGYDRGFYETQLKQDIIEYLSPWAFQDGQDVVFGGKIHRSVILNFVEERPYVDFITDFKMNHIIDAGSTELDIEEAYATTARSILVSSDTHNILQTSSCS